MFQSIDDLRNRIAVSRPRMRRRRRLDLRGSVDTVHPPRRVRRLCCVRTCLPGRGKLIRERPARRVDAPHLRRRRPLGRDRFSWRRIRGAAALARCRRDRNSFTVARPRLREHADYQLSGRACLSRRSTHRSDPGGDCPAATFGLAAADRATPGAATGRTFTSRSDQRRSRQAHASA